MPDKIERSIEELYQDDPERADAVVFGRRTGLEPPRLSRRQRPRGHGRGGRRRHTVRRPHAGQASSRPPWPRRRRGQAGGGRRGRNTSNFPGKSDKLVVLGERPLVAETPEHLLDDDTTPIDKFFIRNNGLIPGGRQGPRSLEDRGRRRGQPEARAHARRAEGQFRPVTQPHGAGMRRQRPLVLLPAGARQPVDQWRRRLRRMDRRAARRRAQGRRRQAVGGVHRPLRRRSAASPTPARMRSRAACRSGKADGREQPHRVRDERAAAAEHPRRAGAAGHSGLAGLGVVEMADPHLGARQGA